MTVENGENGVAVPVPADPLKGPLYPAPPTAQETPAVEQQPLLTPSTSDAPLPASHHAAEASAPWPPPPPPAGAGGDFLSTVSGTFVSFTGSMRQVPVPAFFSGTQGNVAEYLDALPRQTSQGFQTIIARASSAVHDPESESTVGFYVTPMHDCFTLDRLVFTAGAGALPEASKQAAQRTAVLGGVLAVAGLLMVLFPRLPTRALVLVVGACLLVAGIVTLASFVLTLASPGSYIFLLLAIFHLTAGTYMVFNPAMGAFWLCIILAAWLLAKGAGRLSAWRNFHAVEGPSAWRVPNKSGLTLILLGAVLALLSRYPFLLGMLVGWDVLLTGALLGAAGLHSLQSSSQSGPQESDPLVPGQSAAPKYTV